MTPVETPPPLWHHEELRAQRTACSFVIQGCEGALFDLRCSLGRTERPEDVRVGLRAATLLGEVLISCRGTLALLDKASRDDGQPEKCGNLNSPFTRVNNPLNGRTLSWTATRN